MQKKIEYEKRETCLCGYEGRYDQVRKHMKKCRGLPIIKSLQLQQNRIKCEKILLYLFNLKYIKRTDMGNEYFEGDLQSMIDTFDEIANIFA